MVGAGLLKASSEVLLVVLTAFSVGATATADVCGALRIMKRTLNGDGVVLAVFNLTDCDLLLDRVEHEQGTFLTPPDAALRAHTAMVFSARGAGASGHAEWIGIHPDAGGFHFRIAWHASSSGASRSDARAFHSVPLPSWAELHPGDRRTERFEIAADVVCASVATVAEDDELHFALRECGDARAHDTTPGPQLQRTTDGGDRVRHESVAAKRRFGFLWALPVVLAMAGCVQTTSATDVAATAATLNGTVNPEGRPTLAYFEYGTSPAYGHGTSGREVGSGTAGVKVSARVTGLTEGHTYHFRACVESAGVARQCGADATFTTKAAGFQEELVLDGLDRPTAMRFARDGRVFVSEKRGVIKVFGSLGDRNPTVFADLTAVVDDVFDRGLLSLALHPDFPQSPYVYIAYVAQDATCADHFGGCAHEGRVARLEADGDHMTGEQSVLVKGACFQFPGHSMDHLQFDGEGALYVSAGDGASPVFLDFGQHGNVCGDPPAPARTSLAAPLAEGGMMRAQDLRTMDDPVALNGSILRIDPSSGEGLPDNPLAASPDPMARRIVAYGLRNPYRFTIRPGTREIWIADNGLDDWEEINRVPDATGSTPPNYGWPCYEGEAPQPGYAALGMELCENLYEEQTVMPPYYSYHHAAHVVAGDGCPTGGSSVGGPIFKPAGGSWPTRFDGAFFFLDFARECLWTMPSGDGGLPVTSGVELFRAGLRAPVDTLFGPDGNLYYVSIENGAVYRIRHVNGNAPPLAEMAVTPTSGRVPLIVHFDGTESYDPDPGDALRYSWDLDGDGDFDDSTDTSPSFTYESAGSYTTALRVTDENGAVDEERVTIEAGNTPPQVTIAQPGSAMRWSVGERLSFTGGGTDDQDGTLPASAFRWELELHHCNDNGTCHTHALQSWSGVSSGTFVPPNHAYPAHLVLRVTVTDQAGLAARESLRLDPRTRTVTAHSEPPDLRLAFNGAAVASPVARTVIDGSVSSVAAPSPQLLGAMNYSWSSWSDGGAQSHNVTVSGADAVLTARFSPVP